MALFAASTPVTFVWAALPTHASASEVRTMDALNLPSPLMVITAGCPETVPTSDWTSVTGAAAGGWEKEAVSVSGGAQMVR